VQILFAFLLALAFQARFPAITSFQRGVYVVTSYSVPPPPPC
jgi:hypothetical protein